MHKLSFIQHALSKRMEDLSSFPRKFSNEQKKILNFTGDDCLGLSQHPQLKKHAIHHILHYGIGAPATPSEETYELLSKKLSSLLGTESVLLFNSKFQAHSIALGVLAKPQSLLFLDKACHHSLLQAAALNQARIKSYEHNDLSHLEYLLETSKEAPCLNRIIVTESLFSAEGDVSDLFSLAELSHKYRAILYVDDSEAFGIAGPNGMGLASHHKGIDVLVGTFQKTCGSPGAYIGCSHLIKQYLQHFGPKRCDTTLSFSTLGVIDAAIDLIVQMEGERKKLTQRSHWLKTQLHALGFSTGASSTHLIPLLLSHDEETYFLFEALLGENILTTPLFSPHGPHGNPCIRFTIHATHTPEDLNELVSILKRRTSPLCPSCA